MKIRINDRPVEHFHAEQSLSSSFRLLIKTLGDLGDPAANDYSFYLDPAKTFYFGPFSNWKREVEVITERGNLIKLAPVGKRLWAEIEMHNEIFHSQKILLRHGGKERFCRVEEVLREFCNGEHRQWLLLDERD